jgi:hypothetical protein
MLKSSWPFQDASLRPVKRARLGLSPEERIEDTDELARYRLVEEVDEESPCPSEDGPPSPNPSIGNDVYHIPRSDNKFLNAPSQVSGYGDMVAYQNDFASQDAQTRRPAKHSKRANVNHTNPRSSVSNPEGRLTTGNSTRNQQPIEKFQPDKLCQLEDLVPDFKNRTSLLNARYPYHNYHYGKLSILFIVLEKTSQQYTQTCLFYVPERMRATFKANTLQKTCNYSLLNRNDGSPLLCSNRTAVAVTNPGNHAK